MSLELTDYGHFQLVLAEYVDVSKRISYLKKEQEGISALLKADYPGLTQEQKEIVEMILKEECLDLVF